MPRAEVSVDAAPRALDDETVQERVMVIARNQGARRASRHRARHPAASSRSRSISRSTASLRSAPRTRSPTSWKRRCARSLGPAVEVETHIEPLQPPEAAGREAPPERVRGGAKSRSPRSPPKAA